MRREGRGAGNRATETRAERVDAYDLPKDSALEFTDAVGRPVRRFADATTAA